MAHTLTAILLLALGLGAVRGICGVVREVTK